MTRARRTRQLFAGLLLVSVLVVAASGFLLGLKPSASRDWATDQAVAADAAVDGHLLRVRNVRDFRFDSSGTITQRYYDAVYDLDSVETVWFALTTFSKKWRAPAHTFVSFGFADGRYLAISVEARREAEEAYGILAGMFRRYELIYVLGDERDLIGRRVAVEGDATWLYPVRAPRERIRALLSGMATRAGELQRQPEFYHSFLNSCTSNLVAHVNAVAPGRIPAGWKVLVPGYTDDVALSLGLIDDSTSLEAVRRRYRIDRAVAARTIASDSFSAYIRRASN